jgi:hypothetical protein
MAEQPTPASIAAWLPADRDIYAVGLQECMESRTLRGTDAAQRDPHLPSRWCR